MTSVMTSRTTATSIRFSARSRDSIVSSTRRMREAIRVILDFVPNHTSIMHPWFIDSRRSRSSEKRDWYIWRDAAADGGPPNNWLSNFGGSAWSLGRGHGPVLLPCLSCRAAGSQLEKSRCSRRDARCVALSGCGEASTAFGLTWFRTLSRMRRFATIRSIQRWTPGEPEIRRLSPTYSTDQPEAHDVVAGFRRVVDEFDNRVLIGEIYLPIERLVAYYGENLMGLHLPFNFQLLSVAWTAPDVGGFDRKIRDRAAGRRLAELGAQQPRQAARGGARRTGAGARRRHAALNPARNAHSVLRRRAWRRTGRDPARSHPGSVREARSRAWARSLANADAMGRLRLRRASTPQRHGSRSRLIMKHAMSRRYSPRRDINSLSRAKSLPLSPAARRAQGGRVESSLASPRPSSLTNGAWRIRSSSCSIFRVFHEFRPSQPAASFGSPSRHLATIEPKRSQRP